MMSVSSRSTPAPSPASSPRAESAATSSAMEGSRSSAMQSYLNRYKVQLEMIKEREAKKQRYRDEIPEPPPATAFEPEKFGDGVGLEKFADSLLKSAIVSIALFNGDVLLYACSGTAVRHWHGNIKNMHTIFVTTVRLAQKFNDNRTRDDNLRIEVYTIHKKTLHGFLGLYDEKKGIAMVTSFSLKNVYTMDTCNTVDLSGGTLNDKLFAFGCATDGTLMGANCSDPVVQIKALVSVNCKITESGRGGAVMYFDPDGSVHFAGLIVKSDEGKTTLLPTEELHDLLQSFLTITSKTSHFRGYSLPEGVQTVIPSGFMVESKILQSLGYPLPPPLLFELNGRLAGRFEEHFGQLHYWEGYPYNISYNYGANPIWDQLGERLTQEISQSVVSVASFKDNKRFFACTGLLITGRHCSFVLTSASLVRTDGEIDGNLTIKVFLPRDHIVQGTLKLYHQNCNIAVVQLKERFRTDTCPRDILNVRESRNTKSVGRAATGRAVVAIGRATKESHGLLMASMGEVKGKYKAITEPENKRPVCQELFLSTCRIKKVGIGGPLIGLDGSFIGMNFYDESRTTPFLPGKIILTVLRKGFELLQSSTLDGRPVNMEDIPGLDETLKRKRNEWPVSKPYWFLPGQVGAIDQLVGKVLM